MVVVPQNIEDLFSAIQRRDRAQLTAWLDIFSSPEERYAALRALAESLQGHHSGPARDLARWAHDHLSASLGLVNDGEPWPMPSRNAWSDRSHRTHGRDERFNYC